MKVLFLCLHNAGRSQMALGWSRHLAGPEHEALSGGSAPADQLNSAAVRAMAEVGIDITGQPATSTSRPLRSTSTKPIAGLGCDGGQGSKVPSALGEPAVRPFLDPPPRAEDQGMRRDVEASTRVQAPIDRAREVLVGDPGVVVADRVTPDERKARSFHARLAVEVGGGGMHHDVVIEVRPPRSEEGSVTVPVSWRATGHRRLFPAFDGELEASGDELGTTLTLRGAYTVPLGPVGRVGERVAGKRLAHRSLTSFVEQSAGRLDAEVARRFGAEGWHPATYAVSVREIGAENYWG